MTRTARAPGDWFKGGIYQPRKKVDKKCNNCGGQKDEEEKLAGGFKKTLTNYLVVWLPKVMCPVCQELPELLRQKLDDE